MRVSWAPLDVEGAGGVIAKLALLQFQNTAESRGGLASYMPCPSLTDDLLWGRI